MNKLGIGLAALGGLLMVGTQTQAHHAVAGVYDLNKEIVLEGQLVKLNFVNPHASMHRRGAERGWHEHRVDPDDRVHPDADAPGAQQDVDQAGREPEDHGASREKREPGGLHPPRRARRQNVQSRYRITTASIHWRAERGI